MFLFIKPGKSCPDADMCSERTVPLICDMQSNCLGGSSLVVLKRLSALLPPNLLAVKGTPKSEIVWVSEEKLMLHGAAYDKFPCTESLGGDGIR